MDGWMDGYIWGRVKQERDESEVKGLTGWKYSKIQYKEINTDEISFPWLPATCG
jgi:hypothetical protein